MLSIEIPDATIVAVANGGGDSVLALLESQKRWSARRFDRAGREVETVEFKDVSNVREFVFLSRSRRFVLLAGGEKRQRLYWFSENGGPALFSLAVAALRPCFEALALGGDSKDRVFLAGVDGGESGGGTHIVTFDADGTSLGQLPIDAQDAPIQGIAGGRDSLFVAGKRGLLRFLNVESVRDHSGLSQCQMMTPRLFSPDREDQRRWLRIEATANLPDGCTLEICWASTDKDDVRDRLKAVATDESIPASHRIARFLNDPDLRHGSTVYRGEGDPSPRDSKTYSAKLFGVSDRWLWAVVTLTAAPGARLPILKELVVLYPGRTLMEDLPSIYQREEEQPDGFLRALVGVLETTTQGLDARIESMGRRIHPSSAEEPWLDFVASWLGVPWDEALSLKQKQNIVRRATELAKGRGTRAGLETLLECLIPGSPRRFRVTDATADFGFAMVGGATCVGSALPAMLAGRTRWHAELGSNVVLGSTRLPCIGQRDDGVWQLVGRVRIEVAATSAERTAWEPWLLALVTEIVPLTARVDLRWVAPQMLTTNRLDDATTIEPTPSSILGTDAFLGRTRLPEGETRLSATGPMIDSPLQ